MLVEPERGRQNGVGKTAAQARSRLPRVQYPGLDPGALRRCTFDRRNTADAYCALRRVLRHFFSMFQNATLEATSTPTIFLRNAEGCRYWPRWTWVGYSVARTDTASTMAFCLAGSVSLAKASRSRSSSASHGQPNVAFSQLALRKLVETGSSTSTEPHEVRYALQPPDANGSRLARRDTRVCQSMACRSTLKPAFSSSDLATGARLASEAMSVDCIRTTGVPS